MQCFTKWSDRTTVSLLKVQKWGFLMGRVSCALVQERWIQYLQVRIRWYRGLSVRVREEHPRIFVSEGILEPTPTIQLGQKKGRDFGLMKPTQISRGGCFISLEMRVERGEPSGGRREAGATPQVLAAPPRGSLLAHLASPMRLTSPCWLGLVPGCAE